MRINQELKDMWIADLRSDKYTQCQGSMYGAGSFCCLGVLAYNTRLNYNDKYNAYAGAVFNDILKEDESDRLIMMNDVENKNFHEIADWIENNIHVEN